MLSLYLCKSVDLGWWKDKCKRGSKECLQTSNELTNNVKLKETFNNKQWLYCRKWQFLIAYVVQKWPSWFLKLVIANFLLFFIFFWCIILLLIILALVILWWLFTLNVSNKSVLLYNLFLLIYCELNKHFNHNSLFLIAKSKG